MLAPLCSDGHIVGFCSQLETQKWESEARFVDGLRTDKVPELARGDRSGVPGHGIHGVAP